jgi:hypothetical protein
MQFSWIVDLDKRLNCKFLRKSVQPVGDRLVIVKKKLYDK